MCDNIGLVNSDYETFRSTSQTYTYVSNAHISTSVLLLYKVPAPESFTCTNTNCSDKLHRSDIDQLFDDINVALRESSLEIICTCGKTSCQNYIVPGWNDYVKEVHNEARNCYILWCNTENLNMAQSVTSCSELRYILNICSVSANKEKKWLEQMS